MLIIKCTEKELEDLSKLVVEFQNNFLAESIKKILDKAKKIKELELLEE